jgi:hypothetical protein
MINHRNFQIQIKDAGYVGFFCLIYFMGGCETSTRYYQTEQKAVDKAKEKIDYFLNDGEWAEDI